MTEILFILNIDPNRNSLFCKRYINRICLSILPEGLIDNRWYDKKWLMIIKRWNKSGFVDTIKT